MYIGWILCVCCMYALCLLCMYFGGGIIFIPGVHSMHTEYTQYTHMEHTVYAIWNMQYK